MPSPSVAGLIEDRCARCTCRDDLLVQTVIEAARHFMAANLVAERVAARATPDLAGSLDEYEAAVGVAMDALQTLRDSLAAERRAR